MSDKEKIQSVFLTKENILKLGWQLLIGCICVSMLILFAVASWRIARANLNIDLSKFDFSDFLALILGLFAMAMSVAFYFKATDTSNKFYDNVYKFTQETSKILGQIEAGFGERLRHLDEGYSGLQSRIDRFYPTTEENVKKEEKNKEREQKAEAEKKEATDEKQKLIQHLLEKAEIDDKEKKHITAKLEELSIQYEKAEKRLSLLKAERDQMQHEMHLMKHDILQGSNEIEPYLIEILHHPEIRHLILKVAPFEIIRDRFKDILHQLPRSISLKLRNQGILSEDGELTYAGYIALKAFGKRYR